MAAFQGHDTTGDEPFAPGDQVYAEDGDGWRLATVQSTAGNSITLDDGSECAIDELLRCNDADADDVSTLQQIHEPAVLKCLEGRALLSHSGRRTRSRGLRGILGLPAR